MAAGVPTDSAMAPAAPALAAPAPMPPAIMRNAHEVVRNDLKLMHAAAEAHDVAAFQPLWRDFRRFLRVHMAMEDGDAIFGLLDAHFDGVATKERLCDEHAAEAPASASVDAALAAGDGAALADAFLRVYEPEHAAHLAHEEAVMMPLVAKLPPASRALLLAKHVMAPGIATGDFDFFLSHGVSSLATHGSTQNTAAVASRVFAHAAQALSTPEQWAHFLPLVRDAMGPALFAAANAEVALDGPGKLAKDA